MANQYEIKIARKGGLIDSYKKKDHSLDELSGVFAVDLVGDELTVDTLTPVVCVDPDAIEFIAPDDYDRVVTSDGFMLATNWAESRDPLTLEHGAEVWALKNDVLFTKGYFDDAEQIGPDLYQINVVSPVGMLLGRPHHGGIYTGESFGQVCAEIVGDAFPFTVEDDVAALAIYGWLPYVDHARDNLHQLLFACGVVMTKDTFGEVVFSFLYDHASGVIEEATFYQANGSIKHSAPATQVAVTEHTFEALASDERVTVFDNTDGSGTADHRLVTFADAPIHHLEANGLTVHEQGVNYAIVSGTGTLTGQKYTHITQVVTASNEAAGKTPKVVPVSDMTLVSIVNSENVAKRVLAFYTSQRSIKAEMVFNAEQCGRKYSFNDPWGSPVTAFMASMELAMSNIIKAKCELIAGYTPTGQGNNYSNVVVLTGKGRWKRPPGVKIVKAVMISGAEGGYSGGDGQPGERASSSDFGRGGEAGEPGQPGRGGRVLSVTIDVSNLDTIEYSCGEGGEGGISLGTEPTPGQLGEDTVFGDYSTADGQVSAAGVVNLFTGAIYGLSGQTGVAGLAGGGPAEKAESLVFEGVTYTGGEKGRNVNGYVTGVAGGGWGGGPAVGDSGSDGQDGRTDSNNGNGFNDGGAGGEGGSPVPRADATVLGQGGDGGHGGGGGGGGGVATGPEQYSWPGSGGRGGKGGKGAKGGKGGIILYF